MKAFLGTLFILFFVFSTSSVNKKTNNQNVEIFKPGEMLKFEMSYGWVKGGEASLNLSEVKYQGKNVYYVKAVGKTVGVAHALYNIRDTYESYFDQETGKPYKSVMDLKEGDYRNYNEVYYYHDQNWLLSSKSGRKDLGKDVFDIVSAFYHLRKTLFNIKPGDKVVVHTYFNDSHWDLVVRYKGIETIKTDLGKISCMKFKPLVVEGAFESEDALDIWISNDNNRIPVRIKMKLFVGSFKTDLTDYSGLVYPMVFTK
ncbi:MAG: DUF3108 domain-containing protein [Bacteroidales bacterium]